MEESKKQALLKFVRSLLTTLSVISLILFILSGSFLIIQGQFPEIWESLQEWLRANGLPETFIESMTVILGSLGTGGVVTTQGFKAVNQSLKASQLKIDKAISDSDTLHKQELVNLEERHQLEIDNLKKEQEQRDDVLLATVHDLVKKQNQSNKYMRSIDNYNKAQAVKFTKTKLIDDDTKELYNEFLKGNDIDPEPVSNVFVEIETVKEVEKIVEVEKDEPKKETLLDKRKRGRK